MSPALAMLAAERVIAFLEHCGDADIEAGVGAILGIGTRKQRFELTLGLARAIADDPDLIAFQNSPNKK